jgi:hypothetical protein
MTDPIEPLSNVTGKGRPNRLRKASLEGDSEIERMIETAFSRTRK